MLITDIERDARVPLEVYRGTIERCLAVMPVGTVDRLGAVAVYWTEPHPCSPRELQMLQTLADAAASALENIRHYDLLELRVAERTELLQAASRAKSQFLSSMSHELRTPLNAVLGFAQLLEADDNQSPRQLEHIGHIQKAGWHLLELINEVLDLARIETGAMRMSMENVDLRELIAETLLLIGPSAAERRVAVQEVDDPGGSAQVLADRTRLRQVLLNLLTNAVKYNRAGGAVTLSWTAAGGRVRVAVTDTGPGLSAEQLSHLFEAFNRLGREAENIEGTGIGLVITKRLLEAMGGSISVTSEPGRGSTFWIELNASAAEPPAAPANVPHPAASAPTRPCTLLYIEDNPVNLLLVGKLLEAQRLLHMLSANTGAAGLDMARTCQPDLIVLDIGLPDMSGLDVLRELRADERTQGIPVLALSAHAAHSDIERALAAGARRYITKPIRVQEFLDAVYQCLA
jgi:signal transduction histidine kinase